MTSYVEECRREWKRLGVPDLLAEEMATDLEADLVEAQADGVSASEILGESDPRRFAASWAEERGLVSEPPPKKSRRRFWIVLAVVLAVFLLFGGMAAFGLLATTSVDVQASPPVQVSPQPIRSVRVPSLVGMKACQAKRAAVDAGLTVHDFPRSRCNALVIGQMPTAGHVVARQKPVRLRLRGSG
jgi:hypothetical protein